MTNKRQKQKKWLLYSITLVAAYILQSTVLNRFSIIGVTPMLVTCAVVCAAVFEDSGNGAVFGLCAGLLLAFTNTDKAVFYIVTLTVTGAAAGGLCSRFFTRSYLSAVLLCAAGALLCESTIWIVGGALGTLPGSAFITVVLPQAVVSALFAGLFYLPDRYIAKI